MSNPFIDLVATPATPEQMRAIRLTDQISRMNSEGRALFQQVVRFLRSNWENVWENAEYIPAEVLAAMGVNAAETFRTSALLTEAVYRVGAEAPTPVEILPIKYLSAAAGYTKHDDGTIVLS